MGFCEIHESTHKDLRSFLMKLILGLSHSQASESVISIIVSFVEDPFPYDVLLRDGPGAIRPSVYRPLLPLPFFSTEVLLKLSIIAQDTVGHRLFSEHVYPLVLEETM